MMPAVLRQSGPKFERDGEIITPRALLANCETCGAPAPFGEGVNLRRGEAGRWFCGWSDGRPKCIAQDETETAKETRE